jgi:hypothetical protein
LGTRLDGDEFADPARTIPGNALTSIANNNFNSWTLGFRLDVPIGYRDAHAAVREAQLNVARGYYQLRDVEMKTLEHLVSQYRRVIQAHVEIGPAREERIYLQMYLGKIKERIDIGTWQPVDYQNYLTVQQQFAAALATEYRAIADYNTALATFEYAKGTIQRYNNVTVGEGPLPPWASKKAADHIRERTESALKLRERNLQHGGAGCDPAGTVTGIGGQPVGPATGSPFIDELPLFAQPRPPLPDALPPTKPVDPKNPPKPPMPDYGKGGLGGLGVGGPGVSPMPVVARTIPGSVAGGGATPAAGPGDYFRPAGTVALPTRDVSDHSSSSGANGGSAMPSPVSVPPAVPPLPVPTGMGPNEFGPAGRLPPIPPVVPDNGR